MECLIMTVAEFALLKVFYEYEYYYDIRFSWLKLGSKDIVKIETYLLQLLHRSVGDLLYRKYVTSNYPPYLIFYRIDQLVPCILRRINSNTQNTTSISVGKLNNNKNTHAQKIYINIQKHKTYM